ncbi:trypsin-like peptidase domain-containing protein [Phenylobacterium sp.]|uniref:S1C family serine protease n=1 Tax=Phenylobacterium sp. TaxID=1871053 RepID=UPI00289A47E3|nr:trypsin-like peptidase domain-containing protein [Phenylobacterium sp.]
MPAPGADAVPSQKKLPAAGLPGAAAARYSTILDGVGAESRQVTRGAKDAEVYQAASPSVVLVVTRDAFGSGALISADGKIVTNLHVVGDADEVGVVFKPATEGAAFGKADLRRAKVIRRDEVADLALLQVSEIPAGVQPLKLAASGPVQVGSDVHAIGHPTGQAWTYTRGIVSQVRKDYAWRTEMGLAHKATVVQTQTPINPGNSGGPLLDDNLEIIGINSFKSDGEGLNFAVSADDVRAFLALKADRTAARATAVRKNLASKSCEAAALEEWPTTDPKGMGYLVDVDCDGEGDFVVIEPARKSDPITYLFDHDGDGKIDGAIIDHGRDGNFDEALLDVDGDGQYDLIGQFKPGEADPYRYERIR